MGWGAITSPSLDYCCSPNICCNYNDARKCLCTAPDAPQPPSFVGNNYFCENGRHFHQASPDGPYVFYPDDPLWDCQNCAGSCCQPPYFIRTLPALTSNNIELRICSGTLAQYSDTPIDQVELYVQ